MRLPWQRSSNDLLELGLKALDDGDTRKALKIARDLHRRKYTGAYELEVRCLLVDGNVEGAIEVGRLGVARAPQVHRLWYQLGIALSTGGHTEEALEAFSSAITNEYEDYDDEVRFNIAVALNNAERHEESLSRLDTIADESLAERIAELKASCFISLNRLDELEPICAAAADAPWKFGALAHVELGRGGTPESVRGRILAAVRHERTSHFVLWALRKSKAHHGVLRSLRMVVDLKGCNGGDPRWKGAFASYQLSAADRNLAVDLVTELEGHASLDILEYADDGEFVGLAGVYWASPRTFYEKPVKW